MSACTRTSANWAPKECIAKCSASGFVGRSRRRPRSPSAGIGRRAWSRQARSRRRRRSSTPSELIPDEPPATEATRQVGVADLQLDVVDARRRARRRRSGSARSRCRCRCRRRRSAPRSGPSGLTRIAARVARHARRGIGRAGDAGADQPVAVAARPRARDRAVPAEPVGALAQALDEVAAGARAARIPGRTSGSLRMRSSIGSRPQATASSSIADLEREHARASRPARASTTAPARRARRAGGWCAGWAPRTSSGVRRAVCSANSLTLAVCSTTSWASAVRRPSRVGAEADALDGRGAVADEARTSAGGSARASPAGPADALRRPAPPGHVGAWGSPSSRSRRRRAARRPGPGPARARRRRRAWSAPRGRPGWSRSSVSPSSVQVAMVACGSIGLLCSIGVV